MSTAKRAFEPSDDSALEDENNHHPSKRKSRHKSIRRRPRKTSSEAILSGMERHNLKMITTAASDGSLVRLPNFDLDKFCSDVAKGKIVMAARKPQHGLPELRLLAADGPRLVVDAKDKFILMFVPNFWGRKTQAYATDAVDTLDQGSPLLRDDAQVGADKRLGSASSQASRQAVWGLHSHGIAQQHKQTLRPTPSLREKGGQTGVTARQDYLDARATCDGKVNHMTKVLNPQLHQALLEGKSRIKDRSTEGAQWANRWTSVFLNQAIYENRQTALHRDSRGAQYCADFLCMLGDFTGGDLCLPDLNLRLEWLPNAACMFDGRSFAHEVQPWEGNRRLCFVNYIWKSSMEDLGVKLPADAPTLSEILSRVQDENAIRQGREINTGVAL